MSRCEDYPCCGHEPGGDHIETFTPRDDPQGDLQRLIRLTLDKHGPLRFADLWTICKRPDAPSLHDTLNNMIGAGFIRVTRTGLYHGPLPF